MATVIPPRADQEKREILIVDDSPMSLRLLMHILTMHGYDVRCVTSGQEALAAARSSPPDLILLDVMMPEMNGFEMAERLRVDKRMRDIPVIFVSALDDEESKIKAFDVGGVDYVSKPLHMNEVIARVGAHLRLRDTRQLLERQLEEREVLISELDVLNEQLKREVEERKGAQEAREESLKMMRRALARAEALNRVARSLITSEDISDMLETVTESVAQALPADRVVTLTLDVEAQEVTFEAKVGAGDDPFLGISYEDLMQGLIGWVVEHTQPVISPQGQPDPRASPAARRRREKTQSGAILAVPLYYQGTILGTIAAINDPGHRDFGEPDLAQLSAIAGQLSVALANARLSDQTAYLKEFNEGIVQGVAEAILLVDQDRCITFANPAAITMLGYELDEILGQPYTILFPADSQIGLDDEMLGPRSRAGDRFETTIQSQSGDRVPVLASIRPLYQDGEFTGSLAALTDITEIKRAEEQLRQYAADLEAQNAELDAFAHTVAHDLRSPLTGIIGFVDLLHMLAVQQDAPKLLEYVQYIYRNSAKMANIIDELLLLASVREVEKVPVAPLDMARIVDEACDRLDYLIDEYGAEVVVSESWPVAIGHPSWIEEVWVNYLSNAVKYGGRPEAGVSPRVELGHDGLNGSGAGVGGGEIRFWVRDNGPGLTAAERAQLFTPFERLHNVRAEGHGLGLSIVRRILEKLGGRVGVESTPGAGSTFFFTLPTESPR